MINKAKGNYPDAVVDGLPSSHSLTNAVNRLRAAEFNAPITPATLDELGDIPDEFRYILSRGNSFLIGSKNFCSFNLNTVTKRLFAFKAVMQLFF